MDITELLAFSVKQGASDLRLMIKLQSSTSESLADATAGLSLEQDKKKTSLY